MKIKSVFKNLAGRVEELFTAKNDHLNDVDIIEQLDRSWSGKARNGPLHYRPGSREGSHRPMLHGDRLTQPGDYFTVPHIANNRRLTRVSSEPCSISSLAQSHGAKMSQQKDSASSVHCAEAEVLSAPMDIYRQGPSAPVPVGKNKSSGWIRRREQAAANAAAAKRAAAAKMSKAEAKEAAAAQAALPRKSCLKQGGLSTALSREPSVRKGAANTRLSLDSAGAAMQVTSSGEIGSQVTDNGVGSWGGRKVTFGNIRSDSALTEVVNSDPSADPVARGGGSSNDAVDPEALAAALASLEATVPMAQVSTDSDISRGIIIADTSLAMEWPGSDSGVLTVGALQRVAEESMGQQRAASVDGDDQAPSAETGEESFIDSDPVPSEDISDSTAAGQMQRQRSQSLGDAFSEEEAALAVGSEGSTEWNQKFLKRWKAVKQRARLQALGMRSIWKLNSPAAAGGHRPPELLTNELPEGTSCQLGLSGDGIERLSGVRTGVAMPRNAAVQVNHGNVNGSSSSDGAGINRDPSLATMLMGEVAEVC